MNQEKIKQVIVVRRDLKMRKGKIAAQVAHASMSFLLEKYKNQDPLLTYVPAKPEREWLSEKFAKIVVSCETEQELLDLIEQAKAAGIKVIPIVDGGATEFHNVPTLTCAAFGPDYSSKLDEITGNLKLM